MSPHEDLAAQLRRAKDWERAAFYSWASGGRMHCFISWYREIRTIRHELGKFGLLFSGTFLETLTALYEWGSDTENWTPVSTQTTGETE